MLDMGRNENIHDSNGFNTNENGDDFDQSARSRGAIPKQREIATLFEKFNDDNEVNWACE